MQWEGARLKKQKRVALNHTGVLLSLLLVLLYSFACSKEERKLNSEILPTTAVNYDWQAFGHALFKNETEASKSDELAILVADAVSRELDRLGVLPNCDENGRKYAKKKFGLSHSSIGTCGQVSEALKNAFIGAGIQPTNVKIISGLRPNRLNGLPDLSDPWNIDHAAVLYFSEAGPRIYDLWFAGRDQGRYGLLSKSAWRGAPVRLWLKRMRKLGYTNISIEKPSKILVNPEADIQRLWETGQNKQ
jgi:hypothetical protein